MTVVPEHGAALLALYDSALPEVYGYLVSRCGDRALAEDLTSDTFLAAVSAPTDAPRTIGWLIGIARHILYGELRNLDDGEPAAAALVQVPTREAFDVLLTDARAGLADYDHVAIHDWEFGGQR